MHAPAEDFTSRVLETVATIPAGCVMTYGDVAAALDSRAARAVGRVMALYGGDVPWWRVVRSSGHPPLGHEASALPHYRAESTPLILGESGYRVSLRRARYRPWNDR